MSTTFRRAGDAACRVGRGLLRRATVAGAVGAGIGALLFLLFYLANAAALGHDLPAARAHVAAAFAEGTLQHEDYLANNTDLGRHQYNDCLILHQALDQSAPPAQLAVSPASESPTGTRTQCDMLRGFVAGERLGVPSFYHRYIHGHTLLARLLLPHLSVAAIRELYHGALTLLVLAGVALSMVALARGRRPAEASFWLIVWLVFARWFGLETYGQSLGHGPSDIVLLSYLLLLAWWGTHGGVDRRSALVASASFGALTAIFEFLTGGIPLGMAAVLGGLPFALRPAPGRSPLPDATDALIAFCAGVVTCLVLKVALVLYVFGLGSMTDSALQLRMRMGLDSTRGETVGLGAIEMVKKLVKGTDAMAPGMRLMAGSTVALAIAGGVWGAARLLRDRLDAGNRGRVLALLASNGAIALLLLIFWQHTVVHAWFMERTLAWTIASGLALFAAACARRYGAGWAR